ncbi:neuronal acetylcholine receptor subunit alpha-9-like [Saccostrea echinata]|uniref:neuronal acetylcholine receptor subunit alpha-9-like n=1 Tax=Saccostrea echinata TaxID=191078 RepID=UPI002A8334CC|nr:neuronal acetylcholine receptor subunit alpha-9-like [Saccostrea echinata]
MKQESASLCLFLLFIKGISLTSVHGLLYTDAESLLQEVFKNYSTDIRPKQNMSEVLEVSLMPIVFSVNDFDEVSGTLSIVSGFMLIWHDFRLTWIPSNYGGIEEIPVQKQKLWIPNIFLIDPAKKMEAIGDEDFLSRIRYTGIVSWTPAGLIQTLCNVDMYKFPFDTQSCTFTLALWGYLPFEARLIPFNNMTSADTTYYSSNAQWTLQGTTMKRSELGEYDSLIEIRLILKRKSLYFVINMLAPILLLSLLNPLVFALPVESGERVSYAITIFLSFAVFMTLLSDSMPKSSEPMSLMSYFLIVTMSMSTLICVLAVVTMRFHFKDPILQVSSKGVFMLNVLRLRFLCHICRKPKKKSKVADKSAKLDVAFEKKYSVAEKDAQDIGVEKKVTWKILAEGYDRVVTYYFYIFVAIQWFILMIALM